MDAAFSITLDVSQALAAQDKILKKYEAMANAGGAMATGMKPVREEFDKLANSTKEVGKALSTISSSTRLSSQVAQLQKMNDLMQQLQHWSKIGFGNVDSSKLRGLLEDVVNLNKEIRTTDRVVNALASQLKALPKHKFDFSSVEEYRNKLNNLGNELNALKAFKASLDPIDYSKMKGSLETAINTTKQQFRDFTGSKDPYGMIAAFERTFETIAAKSQTFAKDSLAVTKRFITGSEVADSMGLNYKGGLDTLTRNITEATNKAEAEAKRLNQVLRTSFVTPSNPINSLLASKTSMDVTSVVQAVDVLKSMGLAVDRTAEAMNRMDAASRNVRTTIDASKVAYEEYKRSITQANAAQISFIEGMNKLANYKGSKPNYTSSGSYQMMGFAGPVGSGLSSSLNASLYAMSGFNSEAGKVGSKLQQMAVNAQDAEKKIHGLGLVIKRVFEYGIVYRFQNALLSIPGAFYEMNSAMEKFSATYRGIFGEQAASKMEFVKGAADAYGLDIITLANSYKKFGVTLNELGVAGNTTDRIFESFTEGLKKAGASSADSENAFRALIQMYSKGVVSAEEFTRQLSQYIPAANAMAARSLGVTTAEFKKMMAAGQIIPEQFIPEFTKQMKIFGIGWEESAKTMESSVNRMKNNLMELADSKAFQEAFSETTNFISAALKDLGNVFSGGRLAARGDIPLTTWLFGSPEELDKAIKAYDSKMATLDGKITALREKLKSESNNIEYQRSLAGAPGTDSLGFAKNAVPASTTAVELADAEKQKWAQQLQAALKDASQEYTTLQRKFNEGDLSVKADLEYDKAKIDWLLNILQSVLPSFDGKTFMATLAINTDSVQAAMNMVDRLWSKTREGRLEAAKAQYEDLNRAEKEIQNRINSATSSDNTDIISRSRVPELTENLRKLRVEAGEAKENIVSLAKTVASKQLSTADEALAVGVPGKSDIEAKVNAARKKWQNEIDTFNSRFDAEGVSKDDPERIKAITHLIKVKTAAEKEAAKVEGSGGHKEERHANAVDKLTGSLDNLLRKEMGLADEKPLAAAFAAADEKLNSLMRNIKNLALDGGFSLEEATKQAQDMHKQLLKIAADKQLENLFPWLKKDDALKATADIIEQFFHGTEEQSKAVAKSLDDAGMSIWDVFERMKKLTELAPGVRALAEAQRKLSEASSFGEYANAAKQVDTIENSPGNKGEMEAIKEFYETYITLTKGMTESRLEMYHRVAEQAKANGMDEAQAAAYVSSKWQEAEVQRLEAIQKYGSASEAFSARLAQNFETYKDAATKSRESAVQMADSISNMADTVSSGIGQAFGDMIRNIGNGNAKIEDMWKNMLARMLDALASFIEEAITKWTKNLLGSMFGGTSGGSDPISSAVSSISNIRDTGSSTQSSSSLSSLGKSIGKGITSIFSSGDSDSQKMISALSDSSKIEKALQSASPSGYTALTSGASSGGAVATSLSSGAGMLSTIGTTLGVIGGIAGLVGMAFSLFGGEKEEVKKTASGYNVGVVGGRTGMYNVDFYSDGSVMNAGTTNPDIAKKVSDAFKDAAESLHDFAKELNFAVDVLDDFNFPSMNVTEDQLDGYIRNGQNAMAFLALEKAGLRGAFDFVAEDYEVYVDEFERLSTAISTAGGSLSAYGYDLYTLAGLNAEKVAEIRAKTVEVAAGTADAYAAMATSMGASAEAVEYLRSAAGDGSQALSVTDEQLETILEADWASQVIDKVGGEDAFSSIMENLYKNVFDSVEKYANNLEFYTEKANKYIGKLGDSTVTIDNFWQKFDEALKGYLSPEEFEQWADASSWVNQIDTVNDLVEEWNNSMTKFAQSLDARMQAAEGLDYQSELTQQLAAAEWELYEARKAGYDAALIARLQEVQAAELAATKRKHNEEYVEELRDARERYYSATGDDNGLIDIQMEKNRAELLELSKTYNWSPGSSEEKLFQALEQAQAAEMYNMIKELADKIVSAIESLNLESREAAAAGNSDLAGALDLISGFTKEYKSAAEAGVDAATLERLQKVQQAELANYWAEVNGSIIKVNETLEDIRDALLDTFNTFIESQIDAIQSALDNAQTLASAYRSAQTSIQDTLTSWATDSDPSLNAEQTFLNNQAVFGNLFKKAMAGDEEAFSKLSGAAGSYRDSAQAYYGNKSQYEEFYRNLVIQMNQAGDKAGTLADEQDNFAKLYQVQLDLYNLLKTEINSDDPNTAKLQAVVDAIGFTNEAIKTGNTTTSVLQNLTSSGNGGYADIVEAISGQSSLPNTYLSTLVSKQTTLNALMAQFLNVQEKNNLQSQVDAAKTEYLSYYNNAKAAFQSSGMGSYIQAIANSGYGWAGAIGNLTTTSYGFTNGQRYVDWAMAGNQTASAMGSWFLQNYGSGTGYVDWDTAMLQWLSSYGSLPGSSSTNYSAYQSSYQKYQQLLAQLQALGGYADGGISSGAQLAWVSEGTYSNEAHVPLPDGRTIPVTITNSGDTESVSLLAEIRAELEDMRQQQRAIGVEVIKANNTTAKILTEWKNIGMPTTQESN